MRSAVVLSLLSSLLAPGPGARPDARSVLARMARAYLDSPSVTLRFTQTYAPAGFGETAPETGRLTLQAPDQIRFDYDGPEGKVFTFDGEAARQYVAADRQLVVKTLTAAEKARLPLLFFDGPDRILERFEVTARTAGDGLTELALVPHATVEIRGVTLLLAKSGEVRRLTVLDATGNKTTFDLQDKETGGKRPRSDFALVPPAGTRVVTE